MSANVTAQNFASMADVEACRELLRGGSRSFFAASLVLPKSVRDPATGLYAFCRVADDAIDKGEDCARALRDLQHRLDRIYDGEPLANAADRAFADVVMRHGIPKEYPQALLEGFEWDSIVRRYSTYSQLRSYGVRVAGTVGAMMAMVMDVRDPNLIARACDLGVAMQMTNIARDVGEDARAGRLYLPLDWLAEEGVDADAWLAQPVFNRGIATVIRRLLCAADELYERADTGIAKLPAACRPGMHAARLLYAEIGHELVRRGLDSVNARAVVPWPRKARILADAVMAATRSAPLLSEDILEEARFLLESSTSTPMLSRLTLLAPAGAHTMPRGAIEDKVVWLLELFERLERLDREGPSSA